MATKEIDHIEEAREVVRIYRTPGVAGQIPKTAADALVWMADEVERLREERSHQDAVIETLRNWEEVAKLTQQEIVRLREEVRKVGLGSEVALEMMREDQEYYKANEQALEVLLAAAKALIAAAKVSTKNIPLGELDAAISKCDGVEW